MLARWLLLLGAAAVGAGLVLSCGTRTAPSEPGAQPASTAARAIARQQRQSRQRAKNDQGVRKATRPKPHKPYRFRRNRVASVPDGGPLDGGLLDGASDAAVDGAVGDAGATAADAAAPKKSRANVCQTVCSRADDCIRETMPAELGPPPPAASKKMRKRCEQRCQKALTKGGSSARDEAKRCLEMSDCSQFMRCMGNLARRYKN